MLGHLARLQALDGRHREAFAPVSGCTPHLPDAKAQRR